MDGLTKGQIDGWTNKQTEVQRCTYEKVDRQTDG